MNILLQILDEGKTSDAQGRTVSFENTVIVMTSNAGSELKETALGFNRDVATASKEKAMKALKEFLRPEFIGRVDEVILFNSLTKEDLVKISDILINELRGPLQDKGIGLEVGNGVSEIIAEASNGGGRGARDIRRTIRKQIEDKITDILIDRAEEPVSIIEVTAVDGEIKVSYRT